MQRIERIVLYVVIGLETAMILYYIFIAPLNQQVTILTNAMQQMARERGSGVVRVEPHVEGAQEK